MLFMQQIVRPAEQLTFAFANSPDRSLTSTTANAFHYFKNMQMNGGTETPALFCAWVLGIWWRIVALTLTEISWPFNLYKLSTGTPHAAHANGYEQTNIHPLAYAAIQCTQINNTPWCVAAHICPLLDGVYEHVY